MNTITLTPIGVAKTPYADWAPHQPVEREAPPGAFRVELDPRYAEALGDLESFTHVIVISYLDRSPGFESPRVRPPWAKGKEVGLFASRSPARPNPVGLSIVKILRVEGSTIFTSPMDLLDDTPVLDIKPYLHTLDSRPEANDGWVETLDGHEHLLQHLRGVIHDHHDHGHDHGNDHHHHGDDHGHEQ